ncbi:Rieske (2Fe-2S) protein [Georgenia daeguensis]|uniref:Cytochrome bc1 complex Rieske iron-sulfur subunit n=1 Tax=Georgenia daeguensis TaxID=908355 RepID=A0ABP8ETI4_9MICO
MDITPGAGPARRSVLLAGTGLLTVPLLAGCGGDGPGEAAAPPPSAAGTRLLAVSDVPVGSGVVLEVEGAPVVVVQPEAGTVRAFRAVCTHAGCTVQIGRAEIDCPCHGSAFALADGGVVTGPASEPLPPVPVTVVGEDVVLG